MNRYYLISAYVEPDLCDVYMRKVSVRHTRKVHELLENAETAFWTERELNVFMLAFLEVLLVHVFGGLMIVNLFN